MGNRIHFSYHRAWPVLTLMLMLAAAHPDASAQDWKVPADTSYFRSGEDSWNLVESVLRGDPANVLLLLNRGADPNAEAEGGMTALMFAVQMGDSLLVRLLVANGADLERTRLENTTPLLVSILEGHFSITHYLLGKGADPDHRDDLGGSPLIYAAALNDYQTADLLLFYSASDTIRDREGNTPLMTAVFFENIETADVLLQNGVSPNPADNNGTTPLMVAAQQESAQMLRLLLEYGADLEKKDRHNYSALAHAIIFKRVENAKILLDSGARVDYQISAGVNLFDLAIRENQKEMIELLRERGAAIQRRPDFAEVDAGWGNSFNGAEHMMQVRVAWMDVRYGFFLEMGYDFRPVYRKVQLPAGDQIIHQYREFRWAWTHGAGKLFRIYRDPAGISYGAYAGLYGMLSSGSYRGLDTHAKVHYSIAPSAGLYLSGRFAGMKAGAERYLYGTMHEKPWKINLTLFIRIPTRKRVHLYKEIVYENR